MDKKDVEMVKKATCKQWEELWTHFANPNCSKCYGRGYIGWQGKGEKRKPVPCTAKKCAYQNLKVYKWKLKREEMEKKRKEREEVDNEQS